MNENEDVIFEGFQETLNSYLKAAASAPNEEERQTLLEQAQFIIQDWEKWAHTQGFSFRALDMSKPEPETPSAPIVNPRREAILAQRARRALCL